MADLGVFYKSESSEWETPKFLLDPIERFMGVIDLDPSSNIGPDYLVPAKHHFTIEDNGLTQKWFGRVFVNPPWSKKERKPIKLWTEKCLYEYRIGNVEELLLLVPARPDSGWYIPLKNFAEVSLHKRVNFEVAGQSLNNAPFSTSLVYMGKRLAALQEVFGSIGTVRVPYKLVMDLVENGEI